MSNYLVVAYKYWYMKSYNLKGVNNIVFLEKSLHIPLTYLWFAEQVTSLLAWTAAGRLTLSKNKVLRTKVDLLTVSSLIAYEALWWPLQTAVTWVKWIIYLCFCMAVTCKCSLPRASSESHCHWDFVSPWQQCKKVYWSKVVFLLVNSLNGYFNWFRDDCMYAL